MLSVTNIFSCIYKFISYICIFCYTGHEICKGVYVIPFAFILYTMLSMTHMIFLIIYRTINVVYDIHKYIMSLLTHMIFFIHMYIMLSVTHIIAIKMNYLL